MSENNEKETTPAGEAPATEVPLYEFTSATFTAGDAVDFEEVAPAVEPEMNRAIHGSKMTEEAPAPIAVPEPEPAPAPKNKNVPAANHVVGNGEVDEVYLKQCVYKNVYARKSLTVHHLQRRLGELGYGDAVADRDGWYGDLTMAAVKAYQADNKLEATGKMDADTFKGIFAGDHNVRVVLPE